MYVPAILVRGPQGKIAVLIERRDSLGKDAEQIAVFQIGVEQVPIEREGILGGFGGPEGPVGFRFHAKSKLSAKRQSPVVAELDVLDGIEEVLLIAVRLAVQVGKVFIVAQVKVLRSGLRLWWDFLLSAIRRSLLRRGERATYQQSQTEGHRP